MEGHTTTMHTTTEGATMADKATTTTHPLTGGLKATVVTVNDHDGTTTAVQITAPDEPLDLGTLRAAADELWVLSRDLDTGALA